jgi:hypothetical protein
MSTSDTIATGGLTLDEVGDMTQTKQALTEAVLWPLRYPDSFTRLGVEPPPASPTGWWPRCSPSWTGSSRCAMW